VNIVDRAQVLEKQDQATSSSAGRFEMYAMIDIQLENDPEVCGFSYMSTYQEDFMPLLPSKK